MVFNGMKRGDGIVGVKTLLRIAFNGLYIGVFMFLQYRFNLLNVKQKETGAVIFTLFILFQLFNAFNSRELGAESVLNGIGKNKVMVATFLGVFLVHFFIIQVCYSAFLVNPISSSSWLKTFFAAFSIVLVSEFGKGAYRLLKPKVKKSKKLIIHIKKSLFSK